MPTTRRSRAGSPTSRSHTRRRKPVARAVAAALAARNERTAPMKRAKIVTAVGAGVAGVAVALFGGVFREASPPAIAAPPAASARDSAVLTQLLAGLAENDTKAYVARLERHNAVAGGDSITQ